LEFKDFGEREKWGLGGVEVDAGAVLDFLEDRGVPLLSPCIP
jgi:hypothetical protein